MTRLSVNVNKIAVLRNSRGGSEPDVVRAARACLDAGAFGITVHPRPDARHITEADVHALAALTRQRGVEFNLEGNPFAPPRAGYPGFLALCEATRPAQATLVPDSDAQVTSDHGFDFAEDCGRLAELIAALKAIGCRVSLFVDADPAAAARGATDGVEAAARIGAQRVELYTGPFAHAFALGDAGAA
ncbi:pyridoxine 5'-phosphate synthase, partial [Cognatilysobacter lacus]